MNELLMARLCRLPENSTVPKQPSPPAAPSVKSSATSTSTNSTTPPCAMALTHSFNSIYEMIPVPFEEQFSSLDLLDELHLKMTCKSFYLPWSVPKIMKYFVSARPLNPLVPVPVCTLSQRALSYFATSTYAKPKRPYTNQRLDHHGFGEYTLQQLGER